MLYHPFTIHFHMVSVLPCVRLRPSTSSHLSSCRPTPPGSLGEIAGLCPWSIWLVLERLKRSYTSFLLRGRCRLSRCLDSVVEVEAAAAAESSPQVLPFRRMLMSAQELTCNVEQKEHEISEMAQKQLKLSIRGFQPI